MKKWIKWFTRILQDHSRVIYVRLAIRFKCTMFYINKKPCLFKMIVEIKRHKALLMNFIPELLRNLNIQFYMKPAPVRSSALNGKNDINGTIFKRFSIGC